jgi:hypothetical protein
MEFNGLPKDIKEEIWNNLEENEYYKMRLISKDWKNNLENPKSLESKEKLKNLNETKKKWKEGSKFYRGFCFTYKILKNNIFSGVGLLCCYGKVLTLT